MRKLTVLMIGFCIMLAPLGLAAQSTSIDNLQSDFQVFTDDTAKALPLNSLAGTDWSDAYIGQLLGVPPHFGVGVTVGATAIPTKGITDVMDGFGITPPAGLKDGIALMGGAPLPAAVLNGRVGGVLLPFDVGAKIGMIPGGGMSFGDYQVDYFLTGFDVRYALLKGGLVMPKLSVGAGVNYLSGSLAAGNLGSYTVDSIEPGDGSTYSAEFTDTKLEFAWETLTVDAKAQVSKKFLVVTPYGGVGVTMPVSATAGGGFTGTVHAYKDGSEISMEELQEAAEDAGYNVAVDEDGFSVLGDAGNTLVTRIYGGASVSLLLVKLDVGLKYNVNDQSLGLDIGTRVQL